MDRERWGWRGGGGGREGDYIPIAKVSQPEGSLLIFVCSDKAHELPI